MKSFQIKYVDGDGQETVRIISDFHKENHNTIDAFCKTRNERRSFRIDRISQVIDQETSESLNPYKIFGNQNETDSIACATWSVLPAIRALKFFTMYSRGLRKREKEILTVFVEKQIPLNSFSKEEINDWIYKLDFSDLYSYRDGDTSTYKQMLISIPDDLLSVCRDFAFLISSGSGRKPIPESLETKILNEFSDNPIVENPWKQ